MQLMPSFRMDAFRYRWKVVHFSGFGGWRSEDAADAEDDAEDADALA